MAHERPGSPSRPVKPAAKMVKRRNTSFDCLAARGRRGARHCNPGGRHGRRSDARHDGNGSRVALDPAGGPDFPTLIAAPAFQGVAYLYGALSEDDTPIPVLEMIRKMPAVKGYSTGS
jgi:hypothetical protein